MNLEQLPKALFWTIPFAATLILSLFLLRLSRSARPEDGLVRI